MTRKIVKREKRVPQDVGERSMTKQSEAAKCDINNIMAKYEKDAIITHVNRFQGSYGDYTVLPDFHTAMNKMRAADEMFLSLPAKIRDRFDNDAGKFVEFATDEKNLAEMQKLGLIAKPREVEKAKEPEPKKAKEPEPKKEPEKAPDQSSS